MIGYGLYHTEHDGMTLREWCDSTPRTNVGMEIDDESTLVINGEYLYIPIYPGSVSTPTFVRLRGEGHLVFGSLRRFNVHNDSTRTVNVSFAGETYPVGIGGTVTFEHVWGSRETVLAIECTDASTGNVFATLKVYKTTSNDRFDKNNVFRNIVCDIGNTSIKDRLMTTAFKEYEYWFVRDGNFGDKVVIGDALLFVLQELYTRSSERLNRYIEAFEKVHGERYNREVYVFGQKMNRINTGERHDSTMYGERVSKNEYTDYPINGNARPTNESRDRAESVQDNTTYGARNDTVINDEYTNTVDRDGTDDTGKYLEMVASLKTIEDVFIEIFRPAFTLEMFAGW